MKLFIFHHHLQTGGVTRVIRSHVAAVRAAACASEVVLLSGRPLPDGDFGADAAIVDPAWDYLDPDTPAETIRRRFDDVRNSLQRHVHPGDVLHVHNSNLGKNPAVTAALPGLAEQGVYLFLHCHDFAEDRPADLAFMERAFEALGVDSIGGVMYPDRPHVLFGVLNTADRARLLDRGIAPQRVYWLPNPVALPPPPDYSAEECRLRICEQLALDPALPVLLYPVRAIARKNVGEFILFAALFGDRAHWLVTRSPENPREKPEFERWCRFARDSGANVLFDVGRKADFALLLQAADRIVTTSVREGFGMTFLEPWVFGKPVVGRDLPRVTRDFLDSGLILNHLYDSLPIDDRGTDFASLSPAAQRAWIRERVDARRAGRRSPGDLAVESVLFAEIPRQEVLHNRTLIETTYSIPAYGQKLRRVYRALSAAC